MSPQSLEQISKEILAHSGVDEASILKKENRQPTIFKFWIKDRSLGGSPAMAGEARIAHKEPYHQIILTYGLLELAQSEAEAAFIVSHEVAHLSHRHGAAIMEKLKSLVVDWINAHPEVPQSTEKEIEAAVKRALEDPALMAQLNDLKKSQEREADNDGLALMGLVLDPATKNPRYDRDDAHAAMQSARQWLACLGSPADQEGPTHDSLVKRIQSLRLKAAQFNQLEKNIQKLGKPGF